ncbi:hypothetical protein [Mangrovibacterium lignilyticum]|uniref:hypothetical protein n=1 Tax=Mangrovibacterium lignilyticum TaxID=2668052 RepID=UPI0013D0E739|nr:hypothetical protein [Mangrovibacterium lignilyticum]
MNPGKHSARTVFTFHQWKGKGYAVFASLGKLVRIGKLSATVSQNFFAKNMNQPEAFMSWLSGSGSEEDDEAFRDPLSLEQLALLAGVQLPQIAVAKHLNKEQLLPAAYWISYFLIEVRFLLHAGNGLFYSP